MQNNHCHRVTTQLQLINIIVIIIIIIIKTLAFIWVKSFIVYKHETLICFRNSYRFKITCNTVL